MGKVLELFQLDDHIKECDYRYRKLEEKADQVENRLDRIEQLLLQIKETISTRA